MNKKLQATYVALMKEQVVDSAGGDYDITHKEADDLLCRLLQELGYSEVVEVYKKVGKWYE